jgi:hypothetical protein
MSPFTGMFQNLDTFPEPSAGERITLNIAIYGPFPEK